MKSIRLLLGLAGPVVLAALASPSAALAQGGAAAGAWVAPTGHSRADVRIDTIATRHIGLFAPHEMAHEMMMRAIDEAAAAGTPSALAGRGRADVRIDTIASRHIGLFAPDEAAHETVRSVTELAVGGAPSTPREARADRADPRASSGGGLRSTRR